MQENIVLRFESIVNQYPGKIAVKDERHSLTFQELDEYSNALALEMIRNGVSREDNVGIIVEKRVETIAGIIAALKAGAAYLPLRMDYPEERLSFMVKDSGCRLILSRGNFNLDFEGITKMELTMDRKEKRRPSVSIALDNAAYVIYTSGSTGIPKGVVVEHKNILNLVIGSNYFNDKDIVMGQTGSLAFDAVTFEIWGALLNGGELYIFSSTAITEPAVFKRNLILNRVNTMFLTSALFNQFISMEEDIFDTLDQLFIGGEAVTEKYVEKMSSRGTVRHFCNIYGPTETTTFALFYPVDAGSKAEKTPIGKPIANVNVYVLDKDLKKCRNGEMGELFIGGEGVARGYLNRPDLTKEKFIQAPWNRDEKLYRTGDYGKELDSGDIEFIGRMDDQVKIHGFRIELGEIEQAVSKVQGVKDAVVKVFGEGNAKRMCAFYNAEKPVDPEDIRRRIQETLPMYMIPSRIIQVDGFELTENHKINRKALQEPDNEYEDTQLNDKNICLDEDADELKETEKILIACIKKVLKIKDADVRNTFFELGGDSIKAISLSAEIKDYGYILLVKDIIRNMTIGTLSLYMKAAGGKEDGRREASSNKIQKDTILRDILIEKYNLKSLIETVYVEEEKVKIIYLEMKYDADASIQLYNEIQYGNIDYILPLEAWKLMKRNWKKNDFEDYCSRYSIMKL